MSLATAQLYNPTLIHTDSYHYTSHTIPDIERWGDAYKYNSIAFLDSTYTKISAYNVTTGETTKINLNQFLSMNAHIRQVQVYKNFFQRDETYSVLLILFSDDGYLVRVWNTDAVRLSYTAKYYPYITVADGKLLLIDGDKIQMIRNDVMPPDAISASIHSQTNQNFVAKKIQGTYTVLGESVSEDLLKNMSEELKRTLK